jgi:hypothetical protein
MDSKYCSGCYQKRPLSSFAKNGSTSRLLASCAPCRTSNAKSNTKRKALQQLDPNVPPKKRATACTHPKPFCEPTPSPLQPQTLGSLPTAPQDYGGLGAGPQLEKNLYVFSTCIPCRARRSKGKRKSLQPKARSIPPPYELSKPSNVVRPGGLGASPHKKTTSVKYKSVALPP